MKSAIRVGLKPCEADLLTIHELNLMIMSYSEKNKERQKSGIVAAFYSAYFSRLKKLSGADLEEVLRSIDEAGQHEEAMSDEQMYKVMKRLAGV